MKRIDEYIQMYFDGSLSEDEETRLKVFLSSDEGQDSRYDEVRAVMGFFAEGRSLDGCASQGRRKASSPSVWGRILTVAACLVAVVAIGVSLYNKENICVSFAGGKKVTDKVVVMNDVDNTLAELLSGREDMEDQLNSIFGKITP